MRRVLGDVIAKGRARPQHRSHDSQGRVLDVLMKPSANLSKFKTKWLMYRGKSYNNYKNAERMKCTNKALHTYRKTENTN